MAAVSIIPTLTLAETAEEVATALDINFHEGEPGRCDEFPWMSASSAGLNLVLLGIPDPADAIGGPVETTRRVAL